jgi:hypothetical protein
MATLKIKPDLKGLNWFLKGSNCMKLISFVSIKDV